MYPLFIGVPRYELLIREFLKFTPPDHPDYSNLSQALSKLQEVGSTINENKRKAENYNRVLQIQHSMDHPRLKVTFSFIII